MSGRSVAVEVPLAPQQDHQQTKQQPKECPQKQARNEKDPFQALDAFTTCTQRSQRLLE